MQNEPSKEARGAGPSQADRDASGELWQALNFPVPLPTDGGAAAMLETIAYAFLDHRNDERERCARMAASIGEGSSSDNGQIVAARIAAAIRNQEPQP